ncbi:unnamed protein product [Rhizophagus irregularis]|nr:unnamed protein product [Rhizophagus irregularis]
MILDIYFEGPGRQSTAPDIYFESPGRQSTAPDVNFEALNFTLKIKEAETEFRAPISKVKEAERTSISKVQPYKKPKGRFRSPISKDYGTPDASWAPFRRYIILYILRKFQDAESTCLRFNFEGPGRRRTLISKVSGFPEFSWTEFRRFSALWFQPGRNFQHGFLVATWIGWDFEGETSKLLLMASCNPPEKEFRRLTASFFWKEFRRCLLDEILKIQDAARLPYRRFRQTTLPISKVPGFYLKNFKGPRLLG